MSLMGITSKSTNTLGTLASRSRSNDWINAINVVYTCIICIYGVEIAPSLILSTYLKENMVRNHQDITMEQPAGGVLKRAYVVWQQHYLETSGSTRNWSGCWNWNWTMSRGIGSLNEKRNSKKIIIIYYNYLTTALIVNNANGWYTNDNSLIRTECALYIISIIKKTWRA